MGNYVATLSRKGYLTDIAERADRQMAYYWTSNKSQSFLYQGKIRSMQATIQEVGNSDASLLESRIQDDVQTVLGAVFDNVNAVVTVTDTAQDGSHRYNIEIQAVVSEAGNTYALPSLLFASTNGILEQLITLNNYG